MLCSSGGRKTADHLQNRANQIPKPGLLSLTGTSTYLEAAFTCRRQQREVGKRGKDGPRVPQPARFRRGGKRAFVTHCE